MVERGPEKAGVGGSIPSLATTIQSGLLDTPPENAIAANINFMVPPSVVTATAISHREINRKIRPRMVSRTGPDRAGLLKHSFAEFDGALFRITQITE